MPSRYYGPDPGVPTVEACGGGRNVVGAEKKKSILTCIS